MGIYSVQLSHRVDPLCAVVVALRHVGVVEAGLLQPHVDRPVALRDGQVVGEGEVLVLPGVLDAQPQPLVGRRDGPRRHAQRVQHVLQGQPRGAVRQPRRREVMLREERLTSRQSEQCFLIFTEKLEQE